MNEHFPNVEQANELITWAENQNPGKWIRHSYNVANAAKIISQKANMDNKFAYVLGLLHDIGRYEGETSIRHVYAGYSLMKNKGYNDAAKICLTHSFPYKNILAFVGDMDCTKDELEYMENELEKTEYDDYDKLIQLCDALGSHDGICLLEVRWIDVIRRRGVNKYLKEKFNKTFEIKDYFDRRCGMSIYKLFKDEITKNIFGDNSGLNST